MCFLMLLKVHSPRLDTLNLIASHLLRLLIWLHIGVHDEMCISRRWVILISSATKFRDTFHDDTIDHLAQAGSSIYYVLVLQYSCITYVLYFFDMIPRKLELGYCVVRIRYDYE